MFSGIIEGVFPVTDLKLLQGFSRFGVRAGDEFSRRVPPGGSVAIDGVCLTVVANENGSLFFEAIQETLTRSSLGFLKNGDFVNIERSLRFGDEMGGHMVSGHVDGMATITKIENANNQHIITLQVSPFWIRYIFSKGFIALHGASLTVVEVEKETGCFTVHIIPETLKRTTFRQKKEGNRLNFEVDRVTQAVVETAEKILNEKSLRKE